MTAFVRALQDCSLRIWEGLPTVQHITAFVSNQDVPERIPKLGRLLPWPVVAIQRASGTVSRRTCQIIDFGNLWNWSRVPIIVVTYGINVIPEWYVITKDLVLFIVDMAKGKNRVNTRMAIDSAVQFNRYAVGRVEKSLVLVAKTSIAVAVGLFTYVTYAAIPLMIMDQHFTETGLSQETVEGVLGSVLPCVSVAYLLFGVRAVSLFIFNKMARARARLETPESSEADDIQFNFDKKVFINEIVARLCEGVEYAFLGAGIGGMLPNSVCSADVGGALQNWNSSMTVMQPLDLPKDNPLAVSVTGLEWGVWVLGVIGLVAFLKKAWIQANPPKFENLQSVELQLLNGFEQQSLLERSESNTSNTGNGSAEIRETAV